MAPATRPDNMNEIYIGQLRHEPAGLGQPERVLIVYTLAGGGAEGHLHDRYHKNIYYTYFTPADLHFHAVDGRDLGTRIDDAEQEAYLKVADTQAVQRVDVIADHRDPARIIATAASSAREVTVADGDVYVAGLRFG